MDNKTPNLGCVSSQIPSCDMCESDSLGVLVLKSYNELVDSACIFKENVHIETFNISFESTQNNQQYGTKITCTELRGKILCDYKKYYNFSGFDK